MHTHTYCPVCGAIHLAQEAVCLACGRSLKATRPLSTPTSSEMLPGSLLLGRYRVQQQVGAGGFSAVYQAKDTSSERLVAIKAVSLQGLSAQKQIEATDAFHREVQWLSSLRHPSLPRLYEHFSEAQCWYLVREFIEGSSLEEMSRPIRWQEALHLGLLLCEVLQYLHTRTPPVIFRDLKPSNILLTPDGQLFLIDFGIARRFVPGRSRDTLLFGSPGYAAPEQYGRAQTTPRSDLYSLGAVLHHLLTGRDPALTPFQFASLGDCDPALPEELEELIGAMVQREASLRPESVAQVKERLQEILGQHGRPSGRSRAATPAWQVSAGPVDLATLSGGVGIASMKGSQGQASAYYLPSHLVSPVSQRSRLILALLCLLCIVTICIPVSLTVVALGAFDVSWSGNAVPSWFQTPPGAFVLLAVVGLLNVIGLVCGHLGRREAKRVFRWQPGRSKIKQVVDLLTGIGLLLGYLNLLVGGYVLLVALNCAGCG